MHPRLLCALHVRSIILQQSGDSVGGKKRSKALSDGIIHEKQISADGNGDSYAGEVSGGK